jgi:hypothetical protein
MRDWSFYRHMPVFLENGKRLGRAEEIGHAMDVIHVQEGRVVVRDWYIPVHAVRDVSEQGIYLNVTRAELRTRRWNVPDESYLALQGATHGYEYTSPADVPEYGETQTSHLSGADERGE